jgi:hypothetical protein
MIRENVRKILSELPSGVELVAVVKGRLIDVLRLYSNNKIR